MRSGLVLTAGFTAFLLTTTGVVMAQEVPRSFVASPDIYKVVAENDKYRIIEVTWKPGQRDNWHSHGTMTAIYNITDCTTRARTPDGKSTDNNRKAGAARIGSQAPSHSVENTGKSDCKVVIFESK